MLTEDQFRTNVFKILLKVRDGKVKLGVAQRRICRLARCAYRDDDPIDVLDTGDAMQETPVIVNASQYNVDNLLDKIASQRHRDRLAAAKSLSEDAEIEIQEVVVEEL